MHTGDTDESLLSVGDCELPSSTVASIFSHALLDEPASQLYRRSLDALRAGLDLASLSLAASVAPEKLPVANTFSARVSRKYNSWPIV